MVYSQTEKSQLQNKAKAFALLRAKLYDIEQQKAHDAEAELRRSQIGTGDRSEKIRTYNFPQGRVTDHRIKLTLYKIDDIMNGDIDELLDLVTSLISFFLCRCGNPSPAFPAPLRIIGFASRWRDSNPRPADYKSAALAN